MEKNHDNYIFSMTTSEDLTMDAFDVEFFEYNQELCCDGAPKKVVKTFDDLIHLLEEWDDLK